jgi:hypothetical protein
MIMTNFKSSLKQVVIAGGALFVAIAAPIEASRYMGYDVDVISVAAAEESHAGRASTKGTKAGTGSQTGGKVDQASGGNKSSKSVEALLKGDSGSGASGKGGSGASGKGGSSSAKGGPTDESDAPPWAGVKGGKSGGGGKPADGGTKKGDLYGDLYVLIRDPVTGIADTETLLIEGVPTVYVKVQAYTKDPVTGVLTLLPGVWIPRDPATGDLLTTALVNGVPTAVVPSEVEFGRLSVSRSPTKVSDHSLAEALTTLTAPTVVSITQDAAGRLVITTSDGVVKTIDSPLENLALYKAIMVLPADDPATAIDESRTITTIKSSDGGKVTTPLTFTIPTSINIDMLKASLLAAAADKTKTVTLDVLMYMNAILFPDTDLTSFLSSFNYDRSDTYSGKMVTVLVLVPGSDPATYVATSVDLYEAVFGSVDYTTTGTSATDFAQAVDDALQVLEFVHDNAVR